MATNSAATTLITSLLSDPQGLTLLTGPKGSGKTSFCQDVIALAHKQGITIAGFVCPAIFENGVKTGFFIIDIATNTRVPFGTHSLKEEEGTVGHWIINQQTLEWADQNIQDLPDFDLMIIDEIGPLELEQGAGFQKALRRIDAANYKTALVVVRPSLIPAAITRWPQAKVVDLSESAA